MPPKKKIEESSLNLTDIARIKLSSGSGDRLAFPDFAQNYHNLGDGLEMANQLIECMIGSVEEHINVTETLKKTPDYHANFCVERLCNIAEMKMALKDERVDDCYLVFDEEPVSIKNYHCLLCLQIVFSESSFI